MLRLTVRGVPAPKGSMRCVGRGGGAHRLIPDNKPALAAWTAQVVAAATKGRAAAGGPLDGPVGVQIAFYLPRPASVRRTFPHTRGADVDKLARAVLDGLQTGGVFLDDAQVIDLWQTKRYATPEHPAGAVITVWPVDDAGPTT